jgi:hypothetical protein
MRVGQAHCLRLLGQGRQGTPVDEDETAWSWICPLAMEKIAHIVTTAVNIETMTA